LAEFFQHIIDGISVGAIYALIALGYTMVYGVLKLINFAHGDVFMVGAMIGWYVARWTGESRSPSISGALLVTLASMLVCGCLGFVIERLAYRPLRNSPRLNSLITAIGVSFFLEYGGPGLHAGPVSLGYVDVVTVIVSVALMIGLQRIVFHTRIGTAMRAVSFNATVASLMGVNIDRVISFTFVLGSVLAAVAGVLYASKYPSVQPLMGLMPGLKAFVAAVLGGIGNVPGAMLGGLVLGLAEQIVSGYLSSSWRDAVAFGILILVLLVRPTGLLGRGEAEKV